MTTEEIADAPCNIRQLVLAQNLMSTCPNSFESKLYRCIITYGKLLFDLNDDSSIAYLYVFPDSNKSLVFDVDNTTLKIIEGMPAGYAELRAAYRLDASLGCAAG